MVGGDKSIVLNLFGRDVNLSRTLKKTGDEADKAGVKLAALGKIGVITGLASTLPTVLNVVSASITATTAAVALMPGALTAAGAAFGVAAIGVAYFGQALKDVRDPKKFAEDLKGLAPAAQDTATAIRQLLPVIDNLRLNIQEQLFSGAAKAIQDLSEKYLPTLRSRLTSIAAAMNGGGAGLARFLGKPQQIKLVDQILASTASTVDILGRALQPVAGSFLQLAAIGSQFLPSLATLIGQAADRFADFVAQGAETGQLTEFLQTGITLMGVFGSAIGSVSKVLKGVLSAAAQSPQGLESLAAALGSIADQVNSPAFQAGLGQVFVGLGIGASAVAAVMPQVSAALVSVAPAIASIAQGLGGSLASVLSTTAALLISLAPLINALAASFAAIGPGLAPALIGFLAFRRLLGGVSLAMGVLLGIGPRIAGLVVIVRQVATAFRILGLALNVNPVFLIITALGLLAIGLYEAYKHSETFRVIVQTAFRAVATVVLGAVGGILGALQKLFEAAAHIPGIGDQMRGVASGFATAKQFIDQTRQSLSQIPSKVSVGIEYAVSVSGPAGILGAGKYGGPGQGLGVIAPPGGNITVGKKVTGGASYNNGLAVGKGFGSGVGAGLKKTKDYTNNILVKNARSLAAKLKRAMDKLTAIVKARAAYIKQIRDALLAATSITGFEKDENRRGNPGAGYFVAYLQGRLKALRKYAANIAKLRKLGLNRTTLQQILDAGLEGGADDAAALAAGGKKAIGEVNKTQKAIGKVAGGLATGVGNQFYKAGVAAARGLVKGLKSARTALLKVARDLAKGLRDAIRKELKIRSPSRALHEDGRYAGLGFLGGVNSMRPAINKSLSGLARPRGGTGFASGGIGRPVVYEIHNHVHAAVIEDSTGVIRHLDRMAKTAKSGGYRPQTLALQGR